MKNIYVIRNNLACETVSDLFTMNNHALACQGFVNFLKSVQDKTGENDKHFSLWCVGEFDPQHLFCRADDTTAVEVARGKEEALNLISQAEETV